MQGPPGDSLKPPTSRSGDEQLDCIYNLNYTNNTLRVKLWSSLQGHDSTYLTVSQSTLFQKHRTIPVFCKRSRIYSQATRPPRQGEHRCELRPTLSTRVLHDVPMSFSPQRYIIPNTGTMSCEAFYYHSERGLINEGTKVTAQDRRTLGHCLPGTPPGSEAHN